MTDFVEPNFEEKTEALKRDFENRDFVTDFSVSIHQLASFVSNFGTSLACRSHYVPRVVTLWGFCFTSACCHRRSKRVKVPFGPFTASSLVFAESAATSKLAALGGKLAR